MSILIKSGLDALLGIFLAIGAATAGPESQELRIDAASSKMVVHVGTIWPIRVCRPRS
jgi:hypothetical protein